MKNYCEACERNKEAIFAALQKQLPVDVHCDILEIGSGSGQHAIYFNQRQPNWLWRTTELAENLSQLTENIRQYRPQLSAPSILDVNQFPTELKSFDAIFSANTLHIMNEQSVACFFDGVVSAIKKQGKIITYGPYKYDGLFTSESNAKFDLWLKDKYPGAGIRDFEWINELAEKSGLKFRVDLNMPANNQLLVWEK